MTSGVGTGCEGRGDDLVPGWTKTLDPNVAQLAKKILLDPDLLVAVAIYGEGGSSTIYFVPHNL